MGPCVVISLASRVEPSLGPARSLLYRAEAEGRLAWVEPEQGARGPDRTGRAMLARTVAPRLRTLGAGRGAWTALVVADVAPRAPGDAAKGGIAAATELLASLRAWEVRPAAIVVMLLGDGPVPTLHHPPGLNEMLDEGRKTDPPTTVVWTPSVGENSSPDGRIRAAYAILALADLPNAGVRSLSAADVRRATGHYRLGAGSNTDWEDAILLREDFPEGLRRQLAAINAALDEIRKAKASLEEGVAQIQAVTACSATQSIHEPHPVALGTSIGWFARPSDVDIVANWPAEARRSCQDSVSKIRKQAAEAWDKCRRALLEAGDREKPSEAFGIDQIEQKRKELDQQLAGLERAGAPEREPKIAAEEDWSKHAEGVAFALQLRPRAVAVAAIVALTGAVAVTVAVVTQTAFSSLVVGSVAAGLTLVAAVIPLEIIRRRAGRNIVKANDFAEEQNKQLVAYRAKWTESIDKRSERRIMEWNRDQLLAASRRLAQRLGEHRLHEDALKRIGDGLPRDRGETTGRGATPVQVADTPYDINVPPFENPVCHLQRYVPQSAGTVVQIDDAANAGELEAADLAGVERVRLATIREPTP